MDRFKKVAETIKEYVSTYRKVVLEDYFGAEKDLYVGDVMDSVTIVGDSFYGTDYLAEFLTKNKHYGQIRLQKTTGYGTAYRERKPHIIVSIEHNNWWHEFDMETPKGKADCLAFLAKQKN